MFDILLDVGISIPALALLEDSLRLKPDKGGFNFELLNDKVEQAVGRFDSYHAFVDHIKGKLRGEKEIVGHLPPAVHGLSLQSQSESVKKFQQIVELRRAFSKMVQALRDEAKADLASRLGLIHRFDALTADTFLSIARSEHRHWVACLDPHVDKSPELWMASGKLTLIGGAALIGVSHVAELSAAAEATASGLELAGSTGLEWAGELGEVAIMVVPIILGVGLAKKLFRGFKERHLHRFQEEFKDHLLRLSAVYWHNGTELDAKVPRMLIQALEMEKARLQGVRRELSAHVDSSGGAVLSLALGNQAIREALALNAKMLKKLMSDLDQLMRSVRLYHEAGRQDLAGIELYWNRDLLFLPSQLPAGLIDDIEKVQRQLSLEVMRLKRK